MKIEYMRDASLRSRMDTMLYGEFKEMFPAVSNTKKLPRPETIIRNYEDNIFLTASDGDASLVVFDFGLYRYKESGHGTVYSVSECAAIKYKFASGTQYLTQDDTMGMLWHYPLTVVGSLRLEANRASNDGGKHKYYYGADTSWLPGTVGKHTAKEKQERIAAVRGRSLRTLWIEGRHCLTGCQEEVMHYRIDLNKKQKEIAEILQISQPTVSDIISRAKARLREYARNRIK